MEYPPKVLPPHLEELRDVSKAMGASRAIVVGSALREADNGAPVQSYSLFVLPTRAMTTNDMVDTFIRLSGNGTRLMRSHPNHLRHEIRHHQGHIVNLNFCSQSFMFEPDRMAANVPNGLSQIAHDLFTGETHATQLYLLDRREKTITQTVPSNDHGNKVALSVQKRYPDYPIISEAGGVVLVPAPRAKDAATLA